MAPRLTKFNYKWKNIYAWIDSMPEDNHRAYCYGHIVIVKHVTAGQNLAAFNDGRKSIEW